MILALDSEKKHFKIAITDKFQLNHLRYWQLDADIVFIKSLYFESVSKSFQNRMVCIASLLSPNGHVSVYFHNIHLKLSTKAYSKVLFHFMWSKHINSKKFVYDVITHNFY